MNASSKLFKPLAPWILAALAWTAAEAAVADPCTAPVSGFRAGETVHGVVRYIGDGDSLCVGQSADPASWVEVRLANWFGSPPVRAAFR